MDEPKKAKSENDTNQRAFIDKPELEVSIYYRGCSTKPGASLREPDPGLTNPKSPASDNSQQWFSILLT